MSHKNKIRNGNGNATTESLMNRLGLTRYCSMKKPMSRLSKFMKKQRLNGEENNTILLFNVRNLYHRIHEKYTKRVWSRLKREICYLGIDDVKPSDVSMLELLCPIIEKLSEKETEYTYYNYDPLTLDGAAGANDTFTVMNILNSQKIEENTMKFALQNACKNNSVEVALILIDAGATATDGISSAIGSGHEELVLKLIQLGEVQYLDDNLENAFAKTKQHHKNSVQQVIDRVVDKYYDELVEKYLKHAIRLKLPNTVDKLMTSTCVNNIEYSYLATCDFDASYQIAQIVLSNNLEPMSMLRFGYDPEYDRDHPFYEDCPRFDIAALIHYYSTHSADPDDRLEIPLGLSGILCFANKHPLQKMLMLVDQLLGHHFGIHIPEIIQVVILYILS